MTLSMGDTLPNATLLRMGAEGPEPVELDTLTKGRKVAIFAVPGAYTGVCTEAHLPSFMRNMNGFEAKGVEKVICIAVNDPFVLDTWATTTGAAETGIVMLADPAATFTKAVGMNWTAEAVGFHDRSKRYALYAEDGVVKTLHEEDNAGTCEVSAGESLLAVI
ncbi:peroxiredoxin [Jannaschia sp. CCS1]|uniref:peroxiredoxin n=1 Tax=Jannaschia sp. (strain CCS1) TaxID=290400 RepID=UPI000053BFE9|nr:peroxiredoxin [Jannaschia sp. CCS1]ABD53356.1 thiol peroxidase (atypical 2-Cys peroxiredoxin) [Jannaschia sp. CCS1]